MGSRVSVKRIARHQAAAEKALKASRTADSFQNFGAALGLGTGNITDTSGYGFNPITRNRTLLEFVHRGSWLGGVAVDLVADDMTRAGVDLHGVKDPAEKTRIEEAAVSLDIWGKINELVQWARLYGGGIAVMMIKGQDYSTPLRIETIGKGQFRGLITFDRWMLQPSVEDVVTEEGPHMGLPKFYTIGANAPGLRGKKIHYTRCIRMEGVRLPYQQRVMENLWGMSVIERLYDRLVAYDSSTTGAAQLVYKAYVRTYAVEGLRDILTTGADALKGLLTMVQMMRQMASNEGITLIDAKDHMEVQTSAAFAGIGDILINFAEQVAGALQIPLTRLLGKSPGGLGSNGDGETEMYYGGINQQQNSKLKTGVTLVYRALAMSEGAKPGDGFGISFRSLWQMDEKGKSDLGTTDTNMVNEAVQSGLVKKATGLKELQRLAKASGRWESLTDEEVDEAEMEPPPAPAGDPTEADPGGSVPPELEGLTPEEVQKLASGEMNPEEAKSKLTPQARLAASRPEDDGEGSTEDAGATRSRRWTARDTDTMTTILEEIRTLAAAHGELARVVAAKK